MSLTLAKIAQNTASVTFQWGEDAVTVEYYPGKVTEKTFAQVQQLSAMDESNMAASFEQLNLVLAGLPSLPASGLIKAWNIFEDEAETVMFPLQAERLSELPLMLRSRILHEILGDIRPEGVAPEMMR